MKLTQTDIAFLKERGETDAAIKQISNVADKHIKYKIANKFASAPAVIQLIGRETWLMCLERSTFHFQAWCTAPNGLEVFFDTY